MTIWAENVPDLCWLAKKASPHSEHPVDNRAVLSLANIIAELEVLPGNFHQRNFFLWIFLRVLWAFVSSRLEGNKRITCSSIGKGIQHFSRLNLSLFPGFFEGPNHNSRIITIDLAR